MAARSRRVEVFHGIEDIDDVESPDIFGLIVIGVGILIVLYFLIQDRKD